MEEFEKKSVKKQNYEVVCVFGDGLCLYRCMVRFLVDYQRFLNKNEYFYKIFDERDIKEIGASIHLQIILKDWIVKNKNETLDSTLPIEGTITDLVIIDHGDYLDSMDTYESLYSIPANENNYIDDAEGRLYIPPRWGGMTEIYAFSKIFGVKVNQWECKRWKMEKEERCGFDKKGSRLCLMQKIGRDTDTLEFDLLYTDMGIQNRHYEYLRNIQKIKEMKQKMKVLKEKNRKEEREENEFNGGSEEEGEEEED